MVNQTQVQTAETLKATFFPTDKPRSREEGLNVARAVVAHHGHLPAGFEQIVAGTSHTEEEKQT
jgi:hypothetical protein